MALLQGGACSSGPKWSYTCRYQFAFSLLMTIKTGDAKSIRYFGRGQNGKS
jgi:hypothetical protein